MAVLYAHARPMASHAPVNSLRPVPHPCAAPGCPNAVWSHHDVQSFRRQVWAFCDDHYLADPDRRVLA